MDPVLIGEIVAALLTLMVFSYLIGANPLWRIAQSLLVGVSVGYVSLVILTQVIAPQVGRVIQPPAGATPADTLLAAVPVAFGLLMLLRIAFPGAWPASFGLTLVVVVGASLALGGALAGALVPQVLDTMRILDFNNLDAAGIAALVGNIVLVVGIFIVLENTGIHLAALTVFAGAVGVGVGFGLQNIASNFISGLVILAERPITIGDRVEVAGIAGQVEHIRARSTVIRTNDNIAMIVPNTKFIDSPVTNWTYGDPRVRFRIPVGVAYGSDISKVGEALLTAGRENANTLKEPVPTVFLKQFGDNSIDFELVVWSSEMSARPSRYRSDLNFAIEQKFREAGIEFAFPQRDLHIRDGVLKVEGLEVAAPKRSIA